MADLASVLAGTDDPYQTPEEVALRRKRGMQLFNEGTSVAPVQHWTHALGRGLQGALGGYELGQARDQEQAGRTRSHRKEPCRAWSIIPSAFLTSGLQIGDAFERCCPIFRLAL
jgi:hypothetical protein